MCEYLKKWFALRTDRRGVTALEYGLIAAMVAGAVIGGVSLLGDNVKNMFTSVTNNTGTAVTGKVTPVQ